MIKAIGVAGAFLWSASLSAAEVQVPPAVAALVAPVLKAHAVVAQHETFETQAAEEKAMEPLYASRTPVTNEAIAVLLGFYIGEGPGEGISCEAIARGKVMLPFIKKYQGATALVAGVDPAQTRPSRTLNSEVLSKIEAGKDCKWEE